MAKRDYKAEVKHLVEIAKKQGYDVRFDWVNETWRGMNPAAAEWLRKHGEYGPHRGAIPKKTILINKHSEHNNKLRSQTLRHEIIEQNLMSKKKMSYPVAHKHSCRLQSSTKPLKEKY